MEDKTTVELKHPIEVDGVKVQSINLRRVNVRDLEMVQEFKGNDVTRSVKMIASLSGMAPDDVRKLDAADFGTISSVVTDFFGGSLQEALSH